MKNFENMTDIEFGSFLRNTAPWSREMFREVCRRADALTWWERSGNMNEWETLDMLDRCLIKLGLEDLATFSRF